MAGYIDTLLQSAKASGFQASDIQALSLEEVLDRSTGQTVTIPHDFVWENIRRLAAARLAAEEEAAEMESLLQQVTQVVQATTAPEKFKVAVDGDELKVTRAKATKEPLEQQVETI